MGCNFNRQVFKPVESTCHPTNKRFVTFIVSMLKMTKTSAFAKIVKQTVKPWLLLNDKGRAMDAQHFLKLKKIQN